jgi:hypothetical protein
MRVIGEVPHPSCKITLFAWNNKYLVKIEQGMLEQTYKISDYDVTGEADLREMLSDAFLEKVLKRFTDMQRDWELVLEDIED